MVQKEIIGSFGKWRILFFRTGKKLPKGISQQAGRMTRKIGDGLLPV